MSRSSRFQNLERARGGDTASPESTVRLENGGRFESVTGPGEAASTPAVPEAHVERFKLHGQTPLHLDDAHAQGLQFSRCLRCETENGRFSQRCTTCGADLQTPEQLADNAARWRLRMEADARTQERMRQVDGPPSQAPSAPEVKLSRTVLETRG